MCGICGYIGIHEDGLLQRMTDALAHRGPDSAGYFCEGDVGLGHRRLSIIDLAGGDQPIYNEDESLLIIFNGEIFNYQALHDELLQRGHTFRTRSDTEVILHMYEEMGPDCVTRFNGQFAFAIYDRRRRRLVLARDRLGIKPLYYVLLPDGRFLFASEFKAILRYAGFQPTLHLPAVHDYLALRYVPGPGGLFQELRKLPAAHTAVFEDGQLSLQRYWQPELYAGPFPQTEAEYLEGFAEQFERSVRRRLIAEVPVGAYLSGGLDSSVIVAAFSRLVSEPVRTFSVGFDYEHDELTQAAETARRLGCQHTEIACRAEDIALLPDVVYHLDEPVGDAIVIPMYQLARAARKEVTVILTGEGADEIMGGYLFHRALLMGNRLARLTPRFMRERLLRTAVSLAPSRLINLAFDYPAALGRRGQEKVADFLALLEPEQLPQAYRHLISLFDDRDTASLYTPEFKSRLNGALQAPLAASGSAAPFLNQVIDLQFDHWLPEDILMKQDKMAMAHSIEGRVPFMDHELVEYALRIPPQLKIRRGVSKYLLRRYAARLLPESVTARRKQPFYIPLEEYFAQPAFQELMHDTLSDRAIRERGIVQPTAVSRLRQSMDRGEFVYVKQVFSLMVLELWFRIMVDQRGQR
ncbi:MAG: asparagine synthase (glutamine-hydrolyzing) [Anaerolineales bacterium]|nr:asparagine synthase (glutamine-hydrolyzing) [Anaerolineales bacterium]